jgi:ribulose-5-phosphate 4-epimerase/fuculose-1-phosphate aldolase
MDILIKKYADKLYSQGLCEKGAPILGGLDSEIIWSRDGAEQKILGEVISGLSINSILFSIPAEPYYSIINYLAEESMKSGGLIKPEDSETRTFLHDIPVIDKFEPGLIIETLKHKKSVVIRNGGIVTFGIVSPEQAFIVYSSVCFSCFVKFFTDLYYDYRSNADISINRKKIAQAALEHYGKFVSGIDKVPELMKGFFKSAEDIYKAIAEAGRLTVHSRMVDSFFGNISYKKEGIIYISQTGSSLDELEGMIDACPDDNSRTNAVTASSEFSAHKSVYESTTFKSILHGHPKFSVIMSMLCDESDCENRGVCFKSCTKKRFVNDIPVVPGEVGTGPTGISRTLPPVLKGRGAIVWGHGLFTTGERDFNDAYRNLIDIELSCFEKYKNLIKF